MKKNKAIINGSSSSVRLLNSISPFLFLNGLIFPGKICLLIITTLCYFGIKSSAQTPTTQEIYNQLVIAFLKSNPSAISKTDGLITKEIEKNIQRDSLSKQWLKIGEPIIAVVKITRNDASRTVQFAIELRDSFAGVMKDLKLCDTIPMKEIKKLKKTEYDLLRMEDPRFMHRALFPLIGILTGIAGIVTLFYLRS